MATGYMGEIKLIEGLIVAAETLGGEIIFFSLSGELLSQFVTFRTFAELTSTTISKISFFQEKY